MNPPGVSSRRGGDALPRTHRAGSARLPRVSVIGAGAVLLTCSEAGSGRDARRTPDLPGIPEVALPVRPGRDDVDPVLAAHDPRRLLVAGTDADLAAVLVRLLRTERLDIEVAYLPSGRSVVAAVWGLPGSAAASLALHGLATPVPLVRDDAGGVLVGRAEVRDLTGECYCDDVLVLRGAARRLVVAPTRGGIAVRAGRTGRLPGGRVRAVAPTAVRGRGSAVGRAVQVGGRPMTVVSDGVAHPRQVPRWSWYRHTADWLLVQP